MPKLLMEAVLSAVAVVFLFTAGWALYYVTIGWRWYLRALNKHHQRQFFTWRYRMTALMLFTIVYLSSLRKLAHL